MFYTKYTGLCQNDFYVHALGGVENVIATNNTMVAVESAIYFKSNLDRGGT